MAVERVILFEHAFNLHAQGGFRAVLIERVDVNVLIDIAHDLIGAVVEIGGVDGGYVQAERPVGFNRAQSDVEQNDDGDDHDGQYGGVSAVAELALAEQSGQALGFLLSIIHSDQPSLHLLLSITRTARNRITPQNEI